VVKDGTRPATRRRWFASVFTILGVIGTAALSKTWVMNGGLLLGLATLASALILAVAIGLFKPLRDVEEKL